ncbi:MAG TPA: hypothetical protein VGQ41_16670 [Pyrinomonadaceae bacterium]|jgi:hypothetical protein|nr:hypothetical protein [Pyrinomonadaceae bacterium]
MIGSKFQITRFLVTAVWILMSAGASLSQTGECRDEWPGHKVRSVKVKARWLPSALNLPLKKGDDFTPAKLSETRAAVIKAINDERDKFAIEFVKLERLQLVDINFVRACGRKVAAATCQAEGLGTDCVDLEVKPLALSTNPIFMGATLLPLPRSNSQTFLSGVPRLLRIFDPKFGVGADGELGATPDFAISTDLLSLGEVAQGKPAEGRPVELLLKARGSKSLSEPFYTSEINLSLVLKQPTSLVESLGVEASFTADRQPQLDASYLRNSLRVNGYAAFNPATGIVNRVALNGGYRRSSNRLSGVNRQFATENSYQGSAIFDGRIFDGFTRAGLWLDGGKPQTQESYHRIAALIGYEKELPIGEQTIGIEAQFGAGKASKHAPEYSLFYGGNTLANFIYSEIIDPETLTFLPAGPVLRGYGRNQVGFRLPSGETRGAHSYHHFNLSLAIPISSLSAALIPDEVVNSNPRTTLRDLVEFAVNTGEEALSSSFEDEGLSSDEADKKAAKVFSQIKPGVRYLTHYAKLYSLKPLVMFDEARMARNDSSNPQSRYSVGGGVELTVVLAKFQAAYMHAINRFEVEKRGNLVFRLVFTNLF